MEQRTNQSEIEQVDHFVQSLFISSNFQEGMPIFLIWAYHSTIDVLPGLFLKHSFSGLQQVTLIPAATPTPTTNLAKTPTKGEF